jgi:hypothetical protein
VADALAVVLFVLLGRRAHDEGSVLSGTAATAWPFLTGAAAGWVLVLLARRWPVTSIRGGLVVVAATVVLGMSLRHLAGRGVQPSFVAVATTFLALFLLGWRALVSRRAAGRSRG